MLLLLYLALDDSDDRPLIIDQPEENLDPKSVFDELVALFVAAKAKRQVIMVTHNANLVINTDADQIIVASAGPHPSGGLPPITYVAGGLESAEIRKAVCDILEGGEAAFRERARQAAGEVGAMSLPSASQVKAPAAMGRLEWDSSSSSGQASRQRPIVTRTLCSSRITGTIMATRPPSTSRCTYPPMKATTSQHQIIEAPRTSGYTEMPRQPFDELPPGMPR